MKSDLPKVLHPLLKKPLILHVIENIISSGVDDIIVVVGYKGNQIIEVLGKDTKIIWQHEQLGTGHAVLQTKEYFNDFKGYVIVACGDAPLISTESFSSLSKEMNEQNVKASVLTMNLKDPSGYGRMIKDKTGNLLRIVEEKDANDKEKNITEVNTGIYIFDSVLLFENLSNINNDNAQDEYYLPDVLEDIILKGFKVTTLPLKNPIEGSGINSRGELEKIERYLLNKISESN